jgi:hypothetical protein
MVDSTECVGDLLKASTREYFLHQQCDCRQVLKCGGVHRERHPADP